MINLGERRAERTIKLGTVAVDSGCLLLADPTYIRNVAGGLDDVDETLVGRQHGIQVLDGLGILFTAGLGDGRYDVFATVGRVPNYGERVKRVEIVLIDDGTLQARADRLVDLAAPLPVEDCPPDAELLEQSRLAESNEGLMGSALARYSAAQGWDRAQFAEWLHVTEKNLAALYCEPRPIVQMTGGFGFGRGFFPEYGGMMGLASRHKVGNSADLWDAYEEGRATDGA